MNTDERQLRPSYYDEGLFEKNEIVSAYFHYYEKYGDFNEHFHYFHELNAVVAGTGTHYVGDKQYRIKPGDIFIIPPFVKHNYVFDDRNFNVFHIIFKNEFFTRYDSLLKNISGYGVFFDIEPHLRVYNKSANAIISFSDKFDEFCRDFERLASLSENNAPHVETELFALFVVSSVCHGLSEKQDSGSKDFDSLFYVMKAVEFLQKNFSEKLTVDDLSAAANMSKSTFLRYFKRYYDTTPLEYLNAYRIKESQRLLKETNRNVTTIAQECGFFDSSHFIKTFEKSSGLTPVKFREKARAETAN